ncbi:MAG: DUF6252 family protein [Myxococcota bacterium]
MLFWYMAGMSSEALRFGRVPGRTGPYAACLVASLTLSCGGDTGAPDPIEQGGNGAISATVDGAPWTSVARGDSASFVGPGRYTVSGSMGSSALTLSIANVPGPGTYPLGTGSGVSGGTAIYADGGGGWGTALSGDAGTLVLSTLSPRRITGSFSFLADAVSGSATGVRIITDGVFDLPLDNSGPVGEVADRSRGSLRARIGDVDYAAAGIATTGEPSTNFVAASSSTRHALQLTLADVMGPGTIDLAAGSPFVSVSVGSQSDGLPCCWSSTQAGATGSLDIETLTENRVAGTFQFTLMPSSGDATQPIVVTNGVFDLGF